MNDWYTDYNKWVESYYNRHPVHGTLIAIFGIIFIWLFVSGSMYWYQAELKERDTEVTAPG